MKFKVSTLLWLVTLTAIVVGSWLWVDREKKMAAEKVESAEAKMEQFRQELFGQLLDAQAKESWYRRQLGFIENAESMTQPYLKLLRVPPELGGLQLRRVPPLVVQWRALLPNPNDFELCWAIEKIPASTSDPIAAEVIHRSHLDLAEGRSPDGTPDSPWVEENQDLKTGESPVEVIVFFRLELRENASKIFINYDIAAPGSFRNPSTTLHRGSIIPLPPDSLSWLNGTSHASGGYGPIAGSGVEYDYQSLPLLDGPFSLEEPLTLLRVRKSKQIGRLKWEPDPDPCPGLWVWVQKKSKPETAE